MRAVDIVVAVERDFTRAVAPYPDWTTAKAPDRYRDAAREPGGVRLAHVRAALKDPDAVDAFEDDGSLHVLVAKQVRVAKPFVILIELSLNKGQELRIGHAWRIPGAHDDAALSPLRLFAELLEKHGLEADFGGLHRAVFISRLAVPNFAGDPSAAIGMPTVRGRAATVTAQATLRPNGDLSLAWGYAMNLSSYRAEALALWR